MPLPPGIYQIAPFKAFTISRRERAARIAVKQLVLGFTELIILGLVNEILILQCNLLFRGEFSQQVSFDQIFGLCVCFIACLPLQWFLLSSFF